MAPIVDDGDGEHVEYRIPEEIQNRIPDCFYIAFAGELFSVYGWERSRWLFYPEEEKDYVDLDSSSEGWAQAFKATCRKLEMDWLYEYYQTLEWYDSDAFDGIIEQEIGKQFMNDIGDNANSYYQYLLHKSKGSGKMNTECLTDKTKKDNQALIERFPFLLPRCGAIRKEDCHLILISALQSWT